MVLPRLFTSLVLWQLRGRGRGALSLSLCEAECHPEPGQSPSLPQFLPERSPADPVSRGWEPMPRAAPLELRGAAPASVLLATPAAWLGEHPPSVLSPASSRCAWAQMSSCRTPCDFTLTRGICSDPASKHGPAHRSQDQNCTQRTAGSPSTLPTRRRARHVSPLRACGSPFLIPRTRSWSHTLCSCPVAPPFCAGPCAATGRCRSLPHPGWGDRNVRQESSSVPPVAQGLRPPPFPAVVCLAAH